MGLPSMKPQIGVFDDCDRPEVKMLVIVWGHPDHPSVEYINPAIRPLRLRGRLRAFPRRFTELTKFGMYGFLEEGGCLQVNPWGDCVATYPDGRPRRWQGRPIDAVEVRPGIAGAVMKAVQSMREVRHAGMRAARPATPSIQHQAEAGKGES